MKNFCEDNGLKIYFPDKKYTKIDAEKNKEYFAKFSSLFKNFKIMDCSWLDNNTLWLFELKKYYDPKIQKYKATELANKKIRNEKVREYYRIKTRT